MRKWTEEERKRQSELIRGWQPWQKGGVKSAKGKAKSRMNALRHGAYSEETRRMRAVLAHCRNVMKSLEIGIPPE